MQAIRDPVQIIELSSKLHAKYPTTMSPSSTEAHGHSNQPTHQNQPTSILIKHHPHLLSHSTI